MLVHGSRCAFAEARQAPSEFEAGNLHPARNGAIAANCKHKPLSPTACQLALSRLVLWIGMADGVYLSSMDLLLLEAWLRNDLVESMFTIFCCCTWNDTGHIGRTFHW